MKVKILNEFKEFAVKGNVVDMAVGIIIGAAFGKIVNSLVNDIIMPPLGLLMGGVDFTEKAIILKEAVGDVPAVMLKYGVFINQILSFVIVAFAIFMLIKAINRLKKKEEAKAEAAPEITAEVVLLTQIRDALKK